MGQERAGNLALTEPDEDAFVACIIHGLNDYYPAYYARMGPLNRQGPCPVDLSPLTRIEMPELARRIGAGEWAVDLARRGRSGHALRSSRLAPGVGESRSTT